MGRLANLYKGLVFFIFISLIFSGLQFLPSGVDSVFVNKLSDGKKEVILEFDGGDIDGTNLWLEVPVNASIMSASLNVTGLAKNSIYPSNITVNIGNDEDNEWEFRGTGYGQFGRQTLFSDGDAKKYFKFHNTSFKNNARILLPRNSTVTSTSMTLEGGTGTFDEDYFVAVDYYGNRLSYLQSNGDGSFKPPASIDTNIGSSQWASCCMGDFDNDGDHDVIATDGGNGNMFFYEKTAAGNNFKSPVNVGKISTSWYVYDFATGDFTNDGNYDFITSSNSGTLYLFTGNGDGTFTSATISATGGPSNPYTKDAADFDNDGNLDLACGGYRSGSSYVCWIYYGNGDGTFQNAITVTVPFYRAYSIIADDFNNDGDPDILAGYYNQKLVYIENNGNGTFKTGISTSVTSGSSSYNGGDAWDYNRDGNVDVIVCDSSWGSGLKEAHFFLGNGDGTFDVNGTPLGDIQTCYGGAAPPGRLIGAENANLNVGDTGAGYDWEYSGILEDYVAQVPDFKTKLNNLIKTPRYTAFTDHYGNEFVVIPLNFTATNDGLLRISKLDIDYSYTATIFKKKDDNIISELNEHIVYTDAETIKIYFIVTSSSSGKLKFSDLKLTYNIPPDLNSNIPTLVAYEDTVNLNLVDLSTYFIDTDEPTTNLNYSVVMNTQSEHTELFTNWTNTLKFRPLTENWHGETEVVVQVLDSGLKKTYSNKFKIKVLPVNDEPTTKHFLPDMQLIEGGKESQLDLDLREYFTDIENDYLYYSLAIDPMNKLKVDRKEIIANIEDNHMITVDGIGDFNTKFNGTTLPIPIWIYCDDDEDVNTMANGTGNYTRQEILVRIQPVNDPPQWSSVPDVYLMEDDTQNFANCVELYKYLSDDESEPEELIIQILSNSNPNIDVNLNKGLLSVATPENYYGNTIVTLRASEPDPTYRTDTSFQIEIMPVNDEPSIFIHFPLPYADVWGTTKLQGSMFDVEDTVQLVEIKIDSMDASENAVHFDWQQAEIEVEFNNWTYVWDTTTVPDDDYRLSARVYDGELSSETFVNLRVENGQNKEPVVDITTPYEEEAVNGSILIRGTVNDPDNQGIEELKIRIGRDMDWTNVPLRSKNGTVDWYYQWESTGISDGPVVISAKAFDGISWSAPVNRKVEVKNGINDTSKEASGAQDKDEEINYVLLTIIALIVAMIIVGLAGMGLIIRRGRKQIREYVPDGRLEPLVDVEAKLRPALGPDVSIEHAPALPAAPASATGTAIAAPALPAASPAAAATPAVALPALPTATTVTDTATAGTGTSAALPALPPATNIAEPTEKYGLYSPHAKIAQPIPPVAAPKYQPTATTTTIATAQPATTTSTVTAEAKPAEHTNNANQ